MARQQAVAEVNAFVKGLVTEASPMTFPDNAAIDINNLVLNRDGSLSRRLGMNYEAGFTEVNSQQSAISNFAVGSFVWKNPGGYAGNEFVAVQTGTVINLFDSTHLPVSTNIVFTSTIGSDPTVKLSFASVDGILIVVAGSGDVYTFEYDGSSVQQSSGRLKVRDLFGVSATIGGVDLQEGSGIAKRPTSLTEAHTYNLRNQTFAYNRLDNSDESLLDAIYIFSNQSNAIGTGSLFPSNSDSVVPFVFADANDSDDRNSKRYFSRDAIRNPLGTQRAPIGFFIIDALDRGTSRLQEVLKLQASNPNTVYPVFSLPADRTPGGATVVSSFAGRVWFSGFSSQVVDGDNQSPRMGSYILFSRLVQSASDIYKCYQEGDPTSTETPDLVDTDGGFIRLDGAYNIQYMVNVGDALMVIAENGVWKITGGSGYGFKATDYLTSKVTEHGSVSSNSVVLVDNTFMYWSDDGIYHVAQNQYGDWAASNLTSTTIQSFFDNIPYNAKKNCQGLYDSYQRRVRWLYHNTIPDTSSSSELVLDINLSAFYPSKVLATSGVYPKLLSMIKVPPYQTTTSSADVINNEGSSVVTASSNSVITSVEVADSSLSEIYYLVATAEREGTVRYSFSLYRDAGWKDWVSSDGIGVDASAYIVTGWTGMGDFQRQKQMSYLTVYSYKTETGFDTNFVPLNPSSIKVQGQWGWTNSANSGKWTQEFQAYRHKRLWIPSSSDEAFDDGEYVVITKNKLRGRGRVLSLKYSTEPGYDFRLLGWSYLGSISGTV